MQDHYYVAKAGNTLGPYATDEILRQIRAGELSLTDFIFLQEQNNWVAIVDFPAISQQIQEVPKPTQEFTEKFVAEPAKVFSINNEVSEVEWFVLRGEDKFGPFSFADLVKMLRDQMIFEYDYLWNEGMSAWQRVAELEEFSPEKVKQLENQGQNEEAVRELFFRRRHARTGYGGSIVVHNNQKVWKGKGVEVSAGGAGIEMDSDEIDAGQTIYLHFQPGDGVPAFNAVCEVISCREVSREAQGKTFRYGVKFKQIGKNARKYIFNYVRSKEGTSLELLEKKLAA